MRFQPDGWGDALRRPIDMAAVDAGVYVELIAPDFRFVFALALVALLVGTTLWRRRQPGASDSRLHRGARPLLVLCAFLALAFVAWMAATGNGRYFMLGLLLAGPVCVGLAWLLPLTRAMRLTLAIGMVALQAFAVQQAAPWRAWNYATWTQPPYFHVDIPPELRARPATYFTLSAISYSLLAPQFHPDSRWISLHNAPTPRSGAVDAVRTRAFLRRAEEQGRMLLLVPALAGLLTPERLPTASAVRGIDRQLEPFRLRIAQPPECRFLPSRGLAGMGLGEKTPQERADSGFWLCPLARVDGDGTAPARGLQHDAVFRALEALCPRFFPAGGDGENVVLPNGAVRSYHRGDVKAYVYDGGDVFYKYYRAMNPVHVGNSQDLVAGRLRLDCAAIRGRAGQP